MANTLNSDVIIHNELAQSGYLERIQDVLEVFNASSGGALMITNELIKGDFNKEAFYDFAGSLVHRDVNSDADVTAQKIGMGEMIGVKTPFKFGPFETTKEAFKRRQRSVEEFSFLVGQAYADAELDGYIAYATGSLIAAISGNTDMVETSSIATDGTRTITKAMRKFGDRHARMALLAMDSATYFDYVDQRVDAAIYNEADAIIYGGQPGTMGKPVLVSDKMPANKILALQPGAAAITVSQAPEFVGYPVNDKENIGIAWRAEGAVNVNLLGYSYKETAGANPNLATLSAAANWQKHANSNKATAGVLLNLS